MKGEIFPLFQCQCFRDRTFDARDNGAHSENWYCTWIETAPTEMDNKLLHGVPLFESLSESESAAVSSRLQVRRVPRNSLMIHEGEASNSLFIILTGKVKIFLMDETGEEIILNYLHEGDYFGEVSLFDDGHRSASVKTLADSYFAVLEKADLVDLMSAHPELALTFLRGTTRRLRDLSSNVRSLAAEWQ